MSTPQPITYEGGLEQTRQTDLRIERMIHGLAKQIEATSEQLKATQMEVSKLGTTVGNLLENLVGGGNIIKKFRVLG